MRVEIATFVRELMVAGTEPLPPMRIGSDGDLEFLDPATPQTVRDQVAAVLAAHDPTAPAPDTSLADGLARPEIQAILGVIAQQQGTTVEAIQAQAVAAAVALGMAKKAGVAATSPPRV